MIRDVPEFLMGRHVVLEALLAGRRRVRRILLAEGAEEKGVVEQILRLAPSRGIPIARVKRSELDRLGQDVYSQGIGAEVSAYPYVEIPAILSLAKDRQESPFLLVLDCVQDPQNVGALMRTAEAVGIHGVILPTRHSATITPAVSRASVGAVEHLLVTLVTNLARTLDGLKAAGMWVAGLEEDASARDYRAVDLDLPLALVLGSEGHGLRRLVAEKCDLLLRIPMKGRINSLNVSVAGSIAMYRAWEARAIQSGEGAPAA